MPDELPLEWVVVPVADEAEAEQRRHETEKMALFLKEFSLDDLPACPKGMALLMAFAEKHPSMYTVARRAGFSEPAHPFFRVNPAWLAFTKHRGGCYDCCECGPVNVPYDYFPYRPPTAEDLTTYEAAAKTPTALAALQAYHEALGAIEEEQRAGRATTPQRREAVAARRALDAELGLRPTGPHVN